MFGKYDIRQLYIVKITNENNIKKSFICKFNSIKKCYIEIFSNMEIPKGGEIAPLRNYCDDLKIEETWTKIMVDRKYLLNLMMKINEKELETDFKNIYIKKK